MEFESFVLRGKEIFIKSVLQAILSYDMSCFLMPNVFCTDLEKSLLVTSGVIVQGKKECTSVNGVICVGWRNGVPRYGEVQHITLSKAGVVYHYLT